MQISCANISSQAVIKANAIAAHSMCPYAFTEKYMETSCQADQAEKKKKGF